MTEIERMESTYQSWLDAQAARGKLCATCHWWGGWTEHESVQCAHPGSSPFKSIPEMGCCSWEREPGSDDEIHPRPLYGQEWRPITVTAVPRPS